MPVLIGSQNYFKMKKFRCFMQIAYSPNNALITVSCRLRGGCERLRRKGHMRSHKLCADFLMRLTCVAASLFALSHAAIAADTTTSSTAQSTEHSAPLPVRR